MRKVITAGTKTDIDVLACAVAYKNILNLLWEDAVISISNEFGWTVPKFIFERWFALDQVNIENDDEIIIVDLSHPEYINKNVNQDNIIGIRDHHPWFENYRKEKIWNKSIIEPIWACATLIYEKAKSLSLIEKLEKYSIDLLMTAILSNTLNFKAQITKERDIVAYEELRKLSTLPANWTEIYFHGVWKDLVENSKEALINDTKTLELGWKPVVIWQVELRESRDFMIENKDLIEKIMTAYGNENRVYTSPSISEWVNYIFTKSDFVKKMFSEKLWTKFDRDIWTTEKLWLRKEIWKELM